MKRDEEWQRLGWGQGLMKGWNRADSMHVGSAGLVGRPLVDWPAQTRANDERGRGELAGIIR